MFPSSENNTLLNLQFLSYILSNFSYTASIKKCCYTPPNGDEYLFDAAETQNVKYDS